MFMTPYQLKYMLSFSLFPHSDRNEQAFVSCSLGAQMVAGALVGMALMQFIVSCTVSMLLRHVKRYAVIGK